MTKNSKKSFLVQFRVCWTTETGFLEEKILKMSNLEYSTVNLFSGKSCSVYFLDPSGERRTLQNHRDLDNPSTLLECWNRTITSVNFVVIKQPIMVFYFLDYLVQFTTKVV
uniref:Uncharacterized protein n=1 Tax=Solanum lycopersicum TaxID=4081 RepID=A0A3Q7H1G0_SOLLC